jgi:DNA-binding CsgD family transcriptional regulator
MNVEEWSPPNQAPDEVLDLWMQSLLGLDVRAVMILGPDPADEEGSREVVAVTPARFQSAAIALARSRSYGIRWRQTKSPLVAWKNFAGHHSNEELGWVERCMESGALAMVRVDFPTSLDHGFECVMLVSRELTNRSHVHAIAYAAQSFWPLLKEHVISQRLGVSSREREVLLMLAEGHTAKEAGSLLGCAERTVTFHMTNVMGKLKARNQRSLILRACSLGLI